MSADDPMRTEQRRMDRTGVLDALARRYAQPLRRYFERRVRNQQDVPDLVQDVLMRLARLRDLSTLEQPENYLFRTASSALRDQLRKDSTHRRSSHVEFEVDKHGGSDFSAERVLAGRQALAQVHAVIRSLPERTRDIFVLRVFEEQKTSEVAAAIGVSTRAVETHYARALAAIAAALREYRDE